MRILHSRAAWAAFFLHLALVYLGIYLSDYLPVRPAVGFVNPSTTALPDLLEKLFRWDAHWYTYIAEKGYDPQSIVFFPVLILLIKGLSYTGFTYSIAGFIICNSFTVGCYIVFFRVLQLDYQIELTMRILVAFAVFPTSFYLSSIYTEPIFIMFVLLGVYFNRTSKWRCAGISSALAALTRNLGIGMAVLMLMEYLIDCIGRNKRSFDGVWIFTVPAAFAGFMVYNFYLVGNALAFVQSQQKWGRQFGLPWENIWNNILLIKSGVPLTEIGVISDLVLVTLCFVGLFTLTFGRIQEIRRSYLAIAWLWFLVPLFSTSPIYPLYSMSRFVLIIFPIYIFLGKLPNPAFYAYVAISSIAKVFLTACFANWYWLG